MAYRIAGTYVGSCDCAGICACPVDGAPTGPNGECRGALVFGVREGNLDDIDLSGVNFALYNFFPSNLSAGNWKVGIVVDDAASDEQAQAIERIVSGQAGGPFADFAPLIGEYAGMERASVRIADGDKPSGSVSGMTEFQFEPLIGPDGTPTTVRNAMFGFAPEYSIGKAPGQSDAFGLTFEGVYGEHAEYEFSTEMTGEIHPRG